MPEACRRCAAPATASPPRPDPGQAAATVRPQRRSALPWQPPSPALAWFHDQIMSLRTRASRWQGLESPSRAGRQSWLTRREGEAADCTARRSSGSGTAHAAAPTTEAPSRSAVRVRGEVAVRHQPDDRDGRPRTAPPGSWRVWAELSKPMSVLPGGARDIRGDDVGSVTVQAAPGSSGGLRYRNCPNALPGRRSAATQPLLFLDFSSSMRLKRTPLTTSTLQRTDLASDGRTRETCLVTQSPSGGRERYLDPAVTC